MTYSKTPGKLYTVRQSVAGKLRWIVVPVDEKQGQQMRRREEPHVYDTQAQARAVAKRLNLTREMTNTDIEDMGRSLFYAYRGRPE